MVSIIAIYCLQQLNGCKYCYLLFATVGWFQISLFIVCNSWMVANIAIYCFATVEWLQILLFIVCNSWMVSNIAIYCLQQLNGFKCCYLLFATVERFQILLFIVCKLLDIGQAVRVFANGPGDLGSIPGASHTKDSKNGTWCLLA